MPNWIPQNLDKTAPMYRAIADAIYADVRIGVLRPGDKLPTHRDLADELGVNVSTITRAYKEAMYRGLINGTVGRGTYISADAGTDLSLASPDAASGSSLLEMGLVTGFYGLDPGMEKSIHRVSGKRNLPALLRYTPPEGLAEHRETGAAWIKRYGLGVKPDRVMVFSGIQHGLSCCLLSLFRPGDRVAVEQLTYPGIKTIAAMAGVHLVPVEMDGQGMVPEALDVVCRREKVKGVYLVPGVQNPTTASMPFSRREEMAEVIERRNLMLMEDDAFAITRQDNLEPITSLLPEQGVFFAGVSKVFWPGLRVCFSAVPPRFYAPLANAVLNTIWMTPPLNVALVSDWIQTGAVDETIARKREEAKLRNKAVKEILKGRSYLGHETGFFIWLQLDPPWTGNRFEEAAAKSGIRLFGSEKFMVGGTAPPPAVRISLTGPDSLEGVYRGLSTVLQILENKMPKPEPIM